MKPGFTLIETLVAISVLLISVAGPLSIAAQALSSANFARNEVTAFYLAQEGIEYARAVRDRNYLTSSSWLIGMSECVNTNCTVDAQNFTPPSVCSGTCAPLRMSPAGFFNQQTGENSIFTRTFTITPVAGTDSEVIVKVTVSWSSARISRSIQLSDHLLNWI